MPGKFSTLIQRFLPSAQVSKNALVYGLGVYSSKLISLIVFPIVAVQLGMSVTGQYDLIVSTVGILVPVVSMQLGDAVYRWLKNADQEQKTIGVSSSLFLLLILLLLSIPIYIYLLVIYKIPFLSVAYLMLVSQVLLYVLMQLIRGNGQVSHYMHSMLIRSVVFAVGELYAVYFTTDKLENVLWAIVASNVAALFWCALKGIKKEQLSRAAIKPQQLKKVLAYAAPLVVNALGWVLLINANKYIIASKLGHEQNGIFAVTEKLSSPIFFIGVFYLFSAQDFFLEQKNLSSLKPQFMELVKKVLIIMLLGGLLLYAGSLVFLPLIFPDLEPGNQYLPWMIAANFFMISAIYFSIPYLYQKHSFKMALTTLTGILISLILCWTLVSSLGLLGPFLGIVIGGITTLLLRIRYSQRFFV